MTFLFLLLLLLCAMVRVTTTFKQVIKTTATSTTKGAASTKTQQYMKIPQSVIVKENYKTIKTNSMQQQQQQQQQQPLIITSQRTPLPNIRQQQYRTQEKETTSTRIYDDDTNTNNKIIRCVILSDTHGRHDELPIPLPDGDILIHLGDIADRGSIRHIRSFGKYLLKQSHPIKVIIEGNHDRVLHKQHNIHDLLSSSSSTTTTTTTMSKNNNASIPIINLKEEYSTIPNVHVLQDEILEILIPNTATASIDNDDCNNNNNNNTSNTASSCSAYNHNTTNDSDSDVEMKACEDHDDNNNNNPTNKRIRVRKQTDENTINNDDWFCGLRIFGASWNTCQFDKFDKMFQLAQQKQQHNDIINITNNDDNYNNNDNINNNNNNNNNVDFFLTHSHPKIKNGNIHGWDGSYKITNILYNYNIPIHLFGHIHRGRGIVLNPFDNSTPLTLYDDEEEENITTANTNSPTTTTRTTTSSTTTTTTTTTNNNNNLSMMINCASTWNQPVVIDWNPILKQANMVWCPSPKRKRNIEGKLIVVNTNVYFDKN